MPSAKERLQEAFDKTVRSISSDIPLMMHSAGDSLTPDPNTVQLVSALTVQYMGRLVDAAIDAREILHPDIHAAGGTTPPLPPPPLPDHRSAPKRQREEYWDDPLPEPKIRGRDTMAAASSAQEARDSEVEEWVGVAGVDLWEHSRARAAYVRGISSQQFKFPLCHDSYVYGRIREVQAAKMTIIAPLLQDTALHETVQAEGQLLQEQKKQQRRRRKTHADPKKKSSKEEKAKKDETSDPEDEDGDSDGGAKSDDDGDGPLFPGGGMEGFLPAHRS